MPEEHLRGIQEGNPIRPPVRERVKSPFQSSGGAFPFPARDRLPKKATHFQELTMDNTPWLVWNLGEVRALFNAHIPVCRSRRKDFGRRFLWEAT